MALTFPSSPTNGQVYTDTATGNRYVYDSTKGLWKISANTVNMSVSSTPPANVAAGSLWFNREIGRTFVYYDDGDSFQWVETVPSGSIDTNTIAAYTGPIYASLNSNWTATNTSYTFSNLAITTANTAFPNTSNVSYNGSFYVPNGAISIGTNSYPTGKFQVVTANGEISRLTATGASGGYHVSFFDNSTPWYFGSAKATIAGNINDLYFGSGPGTTNNLIFGTAGTERVRIDPVGNVTIPNVVATGNIVANRANVDAIYPRTTGAGVYIPGHVIQVIQTVYASTTSLSGAGSDFRNFTGLDTTIVPKASGSKFLIMYNIKIGLANNSRRVVLKINGSYYNTISTDAYRASSGSIYAYGNNMSDASIWEHTGEYLFTNSGLTNVSISFEVFSQDSGVAYINRSYSYDDTNRGRPTSTLTIMEIAQ